MAGVISRGIRGPIIREGDDIVEIVVNSVYASEQADGYTLQDRDVIAVTESVVARAQGNYVTVDQVAQDIRNKFPAKKLGLVFPILSRNRFSMCLKGIARAMDEVVILFSYPNDEVGNPLMVRSAYLKNRYSGVYDFQEADFVKTFGSPVHPFTGVNYLDFYREVIESEGAKATFLFSNDCRYIASFCDQVLCCDIHTRERSRRRLLAAGAEKVLTLADIMNAPVDGSGYNEQYGLYGSNKATEDTVKLFPRNCSEFVEELQKSLESVTGVKLNCMIYGDGAFKDPVGKIWELADPVVSPAYTERLEGTPNELKLKYLADNDFKDLKGEELTRAMKEKIEAKDGSLKGSMASQGTTPRRLTDLIGSLCDLTSGSGDKGTPIVFIQGYFDTFAEQ